MADPLVVVYTAQGRLDAEIVKMLLISDGIPAEAVQESYGMTLGLTFGKLGKADILVPVAYEARARELIEAMEHDQLDTGQDDIKEDNEDLQ